jgi:hypothetical protein
MHLYNYLNRTSKGNSRPPNDTRELLAGVKQHPQVIELALECIPPKAAAAADRPYRKPTVNAAGYRQIALYPVSAFPENGNE